MKRKKSTAKAKNNKARKSKFPQRLQFSRFHLIVFAVVFGAMGTYSVWKLLAAPAPVVLTALEAESMTLPAGNLAVFDSNASGGQVVTLSGNAVLSGQVDLKLPASSIEVVAKGDACGKSPKMSIKVDENQVGADIEISPSKLDVYAAESIISPGIHNISVSFASPDVACQQATLTIDKISFFKAHGGKQEKPVKNDQKPAEKSSARVSCGASDPQAEAANDIQKIDIANLPDGEEMTEYQEHGGYRITRCDTKGKIKLIQDVEELSDQQGKKLLAPGTITQPEGDLYVTKVITYGSIVQFSPQDEEHFKTKVDKPSPNVSRSIKPPKSKQPSASLSKPFNPLNPVGKVSAATPECSDYRDFRYINGVMARWPNRTYGWYINLASYGNNQYNANYAYLGHWVWAHSYNDCTTPAYRDVASFNFRYNGNTSVYNETVTYNGINTVTGVSNVERSCGYYALACASSWWTGNYNLVETDIVTARHGSPRYDGRVLYYQDTNGCPAVSNKICIDFLGLMAHETGHTLWLDHASRTLQTMWPRAECTGGGGCGIFERSLGVGDIIGLYYLYPW